MGKAKSLMLVGTSSGVGKSVLCTAFCRVFYQDGWRVAPFKAQNMSLNSAATPSGREIGRAQAVQAEACGVAPSEHMNPVLLKPTGNARTQVVVQGRVWQTQAARAYFQGDKAALWQAVVESYQQLASQYEVLVIEGAGSPVELNLKPRDIVNMRIAALADACVLLVADIDRGGVFASVVGTLALLDEQERARVKGVLINRFRGDPELFAEGVRLLEQRAGVPVLGVIPYLPDLHIEEEDSLALDSPRYVRTQGAPAALRIAIVQLPHLANFTDFDPLFLEPGVEAFFCRQPAELAGAHAVILPGTKNTIDDLRWLHRQGFMPVLQAHQAAGGWLVGICGGYQMLGQLVRDPDGHEASVPEWPGLGLLPAVTTLTAEKRTVLVHGHLWQDADVPLQGYEIHMGVTTWTGPHQPFARVRSAGEPWQAEGVVAAEGRILGTYLHGLFDNDTWRVRWLNALRRTAGLPEQAGEWQLQAVRTAAYDRLAAVLRAHVDVASIYRWLDLTPRR